MLDLITDVENNKSDKLREQLSISRKEIENLSNKNQSIFLNMDEESKAKENLEKENAILKIELEKL